MLTAAADTDGVPTQSPRACALAVPPCGRARDVPRADAVPSGPVCGAGNPELVTASSRQPAGACRGARTEAVSTMHVCVAVHVLPLLSPVAEHRGGADTVWGPCFLPRLLERVHNW